MDRIIPISKNEEYIIDITALGSQGQGIGRIKDYIVFVEGALVGEQVRVKIVKVNKDYGFGKLIEIILKSIHRVEPKCSIYSGCGGCQLQHVDYTAQLEFKRNRVEECLTRIGKLKGIKVNDTIGMSNCDERYRNKVQLPIGGSSMAPSIGFYAARSHKIIDMDTCLIQEEMADIAVKVLRKWIQDYSVSIYNEETEKGILRHLMVRTGFKTGEVMVVLVTNGHELPHKKQLVEAMIKEIKGLKGIIQNINSKNTNVVLGTQCISLWGSSVIQDYIGEYRFKISPLSFFQVNPIQTEVLYNKVLEYANLTGEETVFDAYCGTGTISLFLSKRAKKVYGVEIVKEAIENAIENAKDNDIHNVEFIVGKSEEVIPCLIEQHTYADIVVVDPPRKGCEKILLEKISEMNPKRIIYVSCNPSTLSRDLAILKEQGYEAKEVQPVDMFVNTTGVETVVMLQPQK